MGLSDAIDYIKRVLPADPNAATAVPIDTGVTLTPGDPYAGATYGVQDPNNPGQSAVDTYQSHGGQIPWQDKDPSAPYYVEPGQTPPVHQSEDPNAPLYEPPGYHQGPFKTGYDFLDSNLNLLTGNGQIRDINTIAQDSGVLNNNPDLTKVLNRGVATENGQLFANGGADKFPLPDSNGSGGGGGNVAPPKYNSDFYSSANDTNFYRTLAEQRAGDPAPQLQRTSIDFSGQGSGQGPAPAQGTPSPYPQPSQPVSPPPVQPPAEPPPPVLSSTSGGQRGGMGAASGGLLNTTVQPGVYTKPAPATPVGSPSGPATPTPTPATPMLSRTPGGQQGAMGAATQGLLNSPVQPDSFQKPAPVQPPPGQTPAPTGQGQGQFDNPLFKQGQESRAQQSDVMAATASPDLYKTPDYDKAQQSRDIQGQVLSKVADPNAYNTPDKALSAQTRGQQQGLMNLLNRDVNGGAPSLAEIQLKQGTDANIATANALAASGGPQNAAAASRQAAQTAATAGQTLAGQTAALRAQEYAQARGELGTVTTAARGQDLQNLGLDYTNTTNQLGLMTTGAGALRTADLSNLGMTYKNTTDQAALLAQQARDKRAQDLQATGMSYDNAVKQAQLEADQNKTQLNADLTQRGLDQNAELGILGMGQKAQASEQEAREHAADLLMQQYGIDKNVAVQMIGQQPIDKILKLIATAAPVLA